MDISGRSSRRLRSRGFLAQKLFGSIDNRGTAALRTDRGDRPVTVQRREAVLECCRARRRRIHRAPYARQQAASAAGRSPPELDHGGVGPFPKLAAPAVEERAARAAGPIARADVDC